MNLTANCVRFGPYTLYPGERLLLRDGRAVPLAPKAFELLVALAESDGRLLRRDALMKTLWPDSFVEEINLTVNISLLRKVLGASPSDVDYIVTVPRQGYRFGVPVSVEYNEPAPSPRTREASVSRSEDQPASIGFPLEDTPAAPPLLPELPPSPASPVVPRRRWPRAAAVGVPALLIVTTGAWLAFAHHFPFGRPAPAPRTLAVLPFTSIGADSDSQYLGLGMTDALITRLGEQRQMVVRSFSAVRRYAGNSDPVAAGRALQTDAVLDGTVQRLDGQTRVTIRLLRVDTGRVQWTASFDEAAGSAFALEDSISQKLANALTLQLSAEEQRRLATPQTHNSQAYDFYTRGRVALNARTVESVRRSLGLFQQAIDADAHFAAAYAGLADAYILAGSYGNSFLAPAVTAPKAKEALLQALALDPDSAEAHTSLAYLRLIYDWDWAGAEAEFQQAIHLNPAYLSAHHWYSHQLTAEGRTVESHRQSVQTLTLGPTDTIANEHMAWHHLFAREYDTAITQAQKAIEMDPAFVQSHRVLGTALLFQTKGKADLAKTCAEFDAGVQLSHEDPIALSYQARCLALTGRKPQAGAIVDKLEAAARERYISAAEIGAVHAALGEREAAIQWLRKAVDERASALIYLNVDPVFDGLRNDPAFQEIVRAVHLNPALPGPYTIGGGPSEAGGMD